MASYGVRSGDIKPTMPVTLSWWNNKRGTMDSNKDYVEMTELENNEGFKEVLTTVAEDRRFKVHLYDKGATEAMISKSKTRAKMTQKSPLGAGGVMKPNYDYEFVESGFEHGKRNDDQLSVLVHAGGRTAHHKGRLIHFPKSSCQVRPDV